MPGLLGGPEVGRDPEQRILIADGTHRLSCNAERRRAPFYHATYRCRNQPPPEPQHNYIDAINLAPRSAKQQVGKPKLDERRVQPATTALAASGPDIGLTIVTESRSGAFTRAADYVRFFSRSEGSAYSYFLIYALGCFGHLSC